MNTVKTRNDRMNSSNSPIHRTGIFRKSSYSQSEAACVEVADLENGAAVRDTRHRKLSTLFFSASEWEAFLEIARHKDR